MLDRLRRVLPLGAELWQVRVDVDADLADRAGGDIQGLQASAGLVDDAIAMTVGGDDVPVRLPCDLRNRLAGRIVAEDVEGHVRAIGDEEQRVAEPHGFEVGRSGAGHGDRRLRFEVHDADRRRGAAAVALPAGGAAEQAVVAGAVGNVGEVAVVLVIDPAVDTCLHLFLRGAAVNGHVIQLP